MVYLLHFEPAFKRARHYIGVVTGPAETAALARGEFPIINAPIVRAALAAGVDISVARTWAGNVAERERLRKQKSAAQFCSRCQRYSQERRRA